MASTVNGAKEEYAKVVISLENCLLPREKLIQTPSMKDGLGREVETDLRIVGCEFIQASGILLKLPQVAMATGQVIFQRFYYSKSFVKHDAEVYAMACIFLAAKIEEAPRRIRDVINVFHFIKQKRNTRTVQPMEYMGNVYFNRKNQVVKAERRILKELGFCVHVKHPHKITTNYLRILECENNRELTQLAWNYMNDSLRTNVFVRFPPEAVACACIFLSARKLGICLPNKPHWFELFDASLQDLEEISLTILELYTRPKGVLENLLKKAVDLRKEIEEKKNKIKKVSDTQSEATPNTSPAQENSRSGSRVNSPTNKASPSTGNDTKRKGSGKTDDDKKSTALRVPTKQIRRSRSPRNRRRSKSRSPSRSRSRSHSKSRSPSPRSPHSRSRSRSYSKSLTPDSRSASDSFSSDAESPERKRLLNKERRGHRPPKTHSRHRSRDQNRVDKKTRSTLPNSYRERTYDRKRAPRARSRSPLSRSRSRSRSPVRDRGTKRYSKYDREHTKGSDYHRNGVEYRTRGRDKDSRRYR